MENVQVLRDCVDLIIKNLPYKFVSDQQYTIGGNELRGIGSLIEKYSGTIYEAALKKIHTLYFAFKNNESMINVRTMGAYYSAPKNTVYVNIAGFMGSSNEVKLTQVLAHSLDDLPIKTFRAILMHELRHVFQDVGFPKHYHDPKRRDVAYKKSGIELDAAWTHHLEDFDTNKFATLAEYVSAVMRSFADYKELSSAQMLHYKKKTARYYYEHVSKPLTDRLSQPAVKRLETKREQVRSLLLERLAGLSSIDLRSVVPNYDQESRMFLLPDRIINGVTGIVAGRKTVPVASSPIFFLILSLIVSGDGKALLNYIRVVHGVTLTEALENADNSFKGGFDASAMKSFIVQAFS